MEKDFINFLYGKAVLLNESHILFDMQPNHLDNLTFKQISDFYLSSHMMSYLKNTYLEFTQSRGTYFSARCILEGIALYKLFELGKISKEMIELLKRNYFLLEYKNYSKDFKLLTTITNYQTMKKNYTKAILTYKTILKEYNLKTIKKILNCRVPFLLGSYSNYEEIILETLGENGLLIYKNLSFVIHPHDSNHIVNSDFSVFIDYIDFFVVEYLESAPGSSIDKTIEFDLAKYIFHPSLPGVPNPTKNYHKSLLEQLECLNKIIVAFNKKFTSKNMISDILNTYKYLFYDLSIDMLIGLPEQVKMKFKMMIEMFSVFHLFSIKSYDEIQNTQDDIRMLLYTHHAIIKSKLNSNLEYEDEMELVYTRFKRWASSDMSLEEFAKKYLTTFGFLIEKSGSVRNISNTVNVFLKDLFSDTKNPQEITNIAIYQLYYAESQMLSHANGYMINANAGAWSDDINVMNIIETMLFYMLDSILFQFRLHSKIEGKKYNQLIYVLNKQINVLKECFESKQVLYQIPRIAK